MRSFVVGDDPGSVSIELAVVLPLLFAMLLASISLLDAYGRHLALDDGARRAVRVLATTPLSASANRDAWLTQAVHRSAAEVAIDQPPGAPNRYVCVAHVDPSAVPIARRITITGNASPLVSDGTCGSTGQVSGALVQVRLRRDTAVSYGFDKATLTIDQLALARFEATE